GYITDENNTRSSFIRPLSLSISYLAFEPFGISIMALTEDGRSSPGDTSCQGFDLLIRIRNYNCHLLISALLVLFRRSFLLINAINIGVKEIAIKPIMMYSI